MGLAMSDQAVDEGVGLERRGDGSVKDAVGIEECGELGDIREERRLDIVGFVLLA